MEKFKRNEYKFSASAPALFAVGSEANEVRRKQIKEIIDELYEYRVLIKDLIILEPNISQRDIILNLAFYIVNNVELLEKFQRRKEIPIVELRKGTLVSKHFVEKWNDYIIAYIIILANPYYKLVQDYMRIIEGDEKKEESPISLSEEKTFRGIVLSKNKRSIFILTSTGEFKKIKYNTEDEIEVGGEGSGIQGKRIRDYKKYIFIGIIVFIGIGIIFLNQYKKIDRTVLLKTTSAVKMEVNPFGRVIYMYSSTDKGKELVESVSGVNRRFDKVLRDSLKYANENKMIPEGSILVSITGNPIEYGALEDTGKYILENKINLVINNVGTEHKLYEIMGKRSESNKK